ncbi:MAG: hypothetical protein ACI959_000481 [Limisphaerales bacterium]|jgi:hypothetical protein
MKAYQSIIQSRKQIIMPLTFDKALGLLFTLCISALGCDFAQAQLPSEVDPTLNSLVSYEDTLAMLGDSVVGGSSYEVREAACLKFIPLLVKALKTEGSYEYEFEKIRTLSVVQAPDDKFRLFTFQMELWDRTYRYFGAMQFNEKELDLVPLIDASLFINPKVSQDTILDSDNWYGALYYNISSRKHKGKTYYFLFGLDGWDMFSTKKIVEVMYIEKGKLVFGAPVFATTEQGPPYLNRFVLQYKKDSGVGLNYDAYLEQIIYDHLVPENPLSEGIYSTYIGDGSYSGYTWEKGKWIYVDKVFDQMQAFPPDNSPPPSDKKDPFNYEDKIKKTPKN